MYCDFRDANVQKVTSILGNILIQLCTQLDYYPRVLVTAFESTVERAHGTPPSIDLICECFEILSKERRTYIFIDALDEVSHCKSLAEALLALSLSVPCIKIMATSQNDVVIQRVFMDTHHVSLEHHGIEIDRDIKYYVSSRLNFDQDLIWLPFDLRGKYRACYTLNPRGRKCS